MTPLIVLDVHVEDWPARALYDPGANISMINDRLVKKLQKQIMPLKTHTCRTMGGVRLLTGVIKLKQKIMNIENNIWFFVIKDDDFEYDILLGLDCIKIFRLNLDYKLNVTQTETDENRDTDCDIIKKKKKSKIDKSINNHKIKLEPIKINWNEGMPIDQFYAEIEHLTKEQKNEIKNLITENETLFARNRYDVGTFTEQEAHIKLLENKFVARKPYKCSMQDQIEIQKQVAELLKVGLIEESCSPYAAPVTMAFRKAEGEKNRMCCDFRALNKLIIPETFPFPTKDDISRYQ